MRRLVIRSRPASRAARHRSTHRRQTAWSRFQSHSRTTVQRLIPSPCTRASFARRKGVTRTLILLSVVAAQLVMSPLFADRCSSLRPDARVAAAVTVGVFPDPRLPVAVMERAVAAWSVCSGPETEMPRLEIGRHGTRDLLVEFDPAAIGSDERCGSFQMRTITIFARTRTQHGNVVSCGSMIQNLTHELGHALGLADAPRSCSSFAMAKLGPNNGFHRRVRAAECQALSARWVQLPAPPPIWTGVEGDSRVAASSVYP